MRLVKKRKTLVTAFSHFRAFSVQPLTAFGVRSNRAILSYSQTTHSTQVEKFATETTPKAVGLALVACSLPSLAKRHPCYIPLLDKRVIPETAYADIGQFRRIRVGSARPSYTDATHVEILICDTQNMCARTK